MAQLAISVQSRTGLDKISLPVQADVAGDKWVNSGREYVEVTNGSGGSITVTFPITAGVDGQIPTPPSLTIAAGKTKSFGPFPGNWYNDGQGNGNITYSAVTSVKVLVVHMDPA